MSQITLDGCRSFVASRLLTPKPYPQDNPTSAIPGRIGIELEAFPYVKSTASPHGVLPVKLNGGDKPLAQALVQVCQRHGGVPKYWTSTFAASDPVKEIQEIRFPDGDALYFEPGGQVEISTIPCDNLEEAQNKLHMLQGILAEVTQEYGIHFLQCGTHPWSTTSEIGNQLNKPRYRAMEEYFNAIGPYGKQMMLQTCALQVNLDLGADDATQIRRLAACSLLAPFATALFANSPVIAGTQTGHSSHRGFLWQQLDPARTGIVPLYEALDTMQNTMLTDRYLDFGLAAPLIYINALGARVLPREWTLAYWLSNPIDGIHPDDADIANHFSLLFPEVRPKGYIELRSVDAPPVEWQMVPACFYTGLLYNDAYLDRVLELLSPIRNRINALFNSAIYGLDSGLLFSIAQQLMRFSIDGFSQLPDHFTGIVLQQQMITFYEHFTLQRKTFAGMHSL